MKSALLSFLLKLLLFTAVLAIAGYLVFHYSLNEYFFPALPFVYLYFFLLTLGVHAILLKANEKRPQQFVVRFMAATTFKLTVSVAVMVICALLDREKAVPFILAFAVLYLLYTAFEVALLQKRK